MDRRKEEEKLEQERKEKLRVWAPPEFPRVLPADSRRGPSTPASMMPTRAIGPPLSSDEEDETERDDYVSFFIPQKEKRWN